MTSRNLSRTCRKLLRWSTKDFPVMSMSSKYIRHTCVGSPCNTCSINLSKVAGALHRPNGMTLNCQRPIPVENAVFSCPSVLAANQVSRTTCILSTSQLFHQYVVGSRNPSWSPHSACDNPRRTSNCHFSFSLLRQVRPKDWWRVLCFLAALLPSLLRPLGLEGVFVEVV